MVPITSKRPPRSATNHSSALKLVFQKLGTKKLWLLEKSLPEKHIIHSIPINCIIASGIKRMDEKGMLGIKKLMDIAYFIAMKARPFTDFVDHIELEKVYGVLP